jgi:hypothetical protein
MRQYIPFLHEGVQLERSFVDDACTLPALYPSQILIRRESELETADLCISVDADQPGAQISELRRRPPEVLYDEVVITKSSVMLNEQCNRRVQILYFVGRGRVDGQKHVAVQHYAVIYAFGERFGECRLTDPERSVEYNEHVDLLRWPFGEHPIARLTLMVLQSRACYGRRASTARN